MIVATSIEFIKNLAQYSYNDHYYDLHNDYDCQRLVLSNRALQLIFQSLTDESLLLVEFIDVKITMIDFFNIKEIKGLTIDNLYRGRAEINEELIEVSEDGRGYFYLEFYEGLKLEFWAKSIKVE